MKIWGFILPVVLVFFSCAAHVHQVGKGSREHQMEMAMKGAKTRADTSIVKATYIVFPAPVSKKQFYLLNWIPLNEVKARDLAVWDDNYFMTCPHEWCQLLS